MYTSLISAVALHRLIDSGHPLLIFDCHHDLKAPEAGRQNWLQERIPQAGYLHLEEDLSGEIIPGKTGRHPLPDKEDFIALLRSKGYQDKNQQVVVYDSKGGGIAARCWWMFKWIGHEAVAVLDGGYPAWKEMLAASASEQMLATSLAKNDTPFVLPLVHQFEAIDQLRSDDQHLVIDSRTAIRYRGEHEPIDPIAGHIEGAINLPWPDNLDENGRFKSIEALKNRFAPLKDEAASNIFYCGSGVTACHNILAYYHAFGELPGLYPGSWSEWITKMP